MRRITAKRHLHCFTGVANPIDDHLPNTAAGVAAEERPQRLRSGEFGELGGTVVTGEVRPPIAHADDMVVGAIMVMFLMLFAFGASSQRSTNSTQSASTPVYILVMQQFGAPD